MCSIKVLFLLAVAIYVCAAQLNKSQSCLCKDDERSIVSKFGIKDVTIHPKSAFCNKVEIIVRTENGSHFCLKPKAVTRVLANLSGSKTTSSSDAIVASTSSSPSSSNIKNV
ncbi:uncharacterized protein LOC144059288 [Vanacampus margaritifer]